MEPSKDKLLDAPSRGVVKDKAAQIKRDAEIAKKMQAEMNKEYRDSWVFPPKLSKRSSSVESLPKKEHK